MGAALMVLAMIPAVAAAGRLPNVDRAMLKPQYWVSKVPAADAVIMTPGEIRRVNERVHTKGYRTHPCLELKRVPGKRIRSYLEAQIKGLRKWYKYDENNRRMRDPAFSEMMTAKLNLDRVPRKIRVKYGLTVVAAPVRVMPTSMLVQRRPREADFDILQSSVLTPGQPVAGYHRSRDGKWEYVQAAMCRGWVKRADVGWTYDRDEVKDFLARSEFLVVTGESEVVHSDRRLRKKYGRMGMGTKLPLVRREKKTIVVGVPYRGENGRLKFGTGYLKRNAKVSEGCLKFTARNLAEQAFKLLEEPYGWGGTESQLDCSRFVMNVFATFGFELERTSFLQTRRFSRRKFPSSPSGRRRQFDELPGLGALLEFPGHIGLYLGKAKGRHYIIHSLGSYHVRKEERDVELRVKRVVVSDLQLGDGGKKGSLYETAKASAVMR